MDAVTAKGTVHIEGGGANSIHIMDSELGWIIVDKTTGQTLRIVVEGTSTVDTLTAKSAVTIVDNTGFVNSGVLKVLVDESVSAESVITLIGRFLEVSSDADDIDIILEGFVKTLENNGLNATLNGDSIEVGVVPVAFGVLTDDASGSGSSGSSDDWTLVWQDEFDGTELDMSKWQYETGNWIVDEEGNGVAAGWGNEELQYYTDSEANVYLADGNLVLKAQIEDASDEFGEYDFTSGKVISRDLFSKKYGKFEARMKLPEGQGLWPAFWMMPQDNTYGGWASSGEIDIMEAHGSDPSSIGGTIHYGEVWPNNKYSGREYEFHESTTYMDYHVYGVEWEPGEIRWYVDGELYSTQDNWYSKGPDQAINYSYPAPFDQEFYFILNLAVGGWYDGDPESLEIFPAEVYVDYVRAYDLTGREYMEAEVPAYAPEELPADAKVELADGNLVYNANYDGIDLGDLNLDTLYANIDTDGIDGVANSDYWYFLEGFGGDGDVSVDAVGDSNYAMVEIANGGTQSYAIQLVQDVSIATDNYYTLSFDAKASAGRDVTVKVGGDGNDGDAHGWSAYAGETFALTDAVDSYEYTFQMSYDTDLDARLEFNLGLNTSTVWIGNVSLEAVEPPVVDYDAAKKPQVDGNHVYNGTFDQGDLSRMSYWNIATVDATASASVDEATRELEVAISDGGADASAVQVYQIGMKLEALKEYEITFDARADETRTIEFEVVNEDDTVVYADVQEVELTDAMTTSTLGFVMPDLSNTLGRIQFNIGGASGEVYLDNVNMVKLGDYIQGDPGMSHLFREGFAETSGITGLCEPLGNTSMMISSIAKDGEEALAFKHSAGSWGGFYANLSESVDVSAYDNLVVSVQNLNGADYFEIKPEGGGTGMALNLFSYTPVSDGDWDVYTISLDDFTGVDFTQFNIMGFWNPQIGGSFVDCEILMDDLYFAVEPTFGIPTATFDASEDVWTGWWGDQWSGVSTGILEVTGGALVIDITSVGGASYSPQIYKDGFGLENGKTYTVSFDVKADEARDMNVNIGKALDSDPWFTNYAPTEVVAITTTSQAISYNFTVSEATDTNLKMVFELGTIDGTGVATKVYLDNISVVEN